MINEPATVCAFARPTFFLGALLSTLAVGEVGLQAENGPRKTSTGSEPQLATARFHQKPSPLSPSAKSVTNASFLGPNRDGKYAETKLLKKWSRGGPQLVWEMETGNGYASPAVSADRLIYFHRIDDAAVV